jgi:ATP-dependent Clp protease ATP-binding subunit ClpB
MVHVKNFLTPELLNRLDNVIIFRPLSKELMAKIFNDQLSAFLGTWKDKHPGLKLPRYTDKKVQEIIDKIYDPQF